LRRFERFPSWYYTGARVEPIIAGLTNHLKPANRQWLSLTATIFIFARVFNRLVWLPLERRYIAFASLQCCFHLKWRAKADVSAAALQEHLLQRYKNVTAAQGLPQLSRRIVIAEITCFSSCNDSTVRSMNEGSSDVTA
jgi:hypothetical protein